MNVFLSCVSTEFKSYRLRLANQLGALKDHPYEIKVQEDFQQGGYTLLGKLAEYIRDCDLVIHLAGDACGECSTAEHVQALYLSLGEAPPDSLPDRSYTQWEFHLALRFQRKMLVYLAAAEAPRDCPLPVQQSDDAAHSQQAHIAAIKADGKHYGTFTGYNTLLREIFHDLGLEPDLKINNLPFKSLGSLFTGREEYLRKMRAALGRVEHHGHQRFAAITASATTAAVYGLGGIGKTRCAIEYAHRNADKYTALLFARADTPSGLQQNLAALCGSHVLNLPEQNAREIDVQMASVLRWLQQHPGWLLIFDNADSNEAAQAVQELLGRLTHAGQVLVTSRLSNWPGAVESLALDVLEEADATAFLLERTAKRRRRAPDDAAQAHRLAVELGRLALALEQAGAYIEHYRCTFAGYLAEWQQQHEKVLEWFDPRVMQYPMSVAMTWQTSFDRLDERARELLRLLAWFAPDPIPESLLEAAGGPFSEEEPGRAAPSTDAREALADLEAQSLVTRAVESASFAVHRLVQDVTRSSLHDNRSRPCLEVALRWVNSAFDGDLQDVRTWPVLAPLAAHALAVTRHADVAQISEPTADLMNRLGVLYNARAQYFEAEPLVRRALAIDEKFYAPNDPIVARDLNNLAQLLKRTNRHGEAEPLMKRVVEIWEKAYGTEHPNVASAVHNLARLLEGTNRLGEAEPLMKRALAIDEKSYGPDHPDVARDLSSLAGLLQDTNRLVEAEPLMKRALAINEKSYGSDHPEVAKDLSHLAGLLRATNRLAEAEPLLRRALAIDESSYGPLHPHIVISLSSLGLLLEDTNRLGEAEPLLRRALAIDENTYGPDHPDVARDLNSLAALLQATNRLGEAEPLMKRAIEIFETAYGPEHPDVATALNSLALLLQATNRIGEAEPLLRRALAIDESSHGLDHPEVARDLGNLALLLLDTNRSGEAEPLLRRALAIRESSYGPDHPRVAGVIASLAGLLQATNRSGEAEPLLRRALAIDENSYGPDHPDVARDLNNLAALLWATNRLGEAEPLMKRSIEIFEKAYGLEHPDVAAALNNLARLLQAKNRLVEAEPLMRRNLKILLKFTRDIGHEHPHLRTAIGNYVRLLQQMGYTDKQVRARLRKIAVKYGLSIGYE